MNFIVKFNVPIHLGNGWNLFKNIYPGRKIDMTKPLRVVQVLDPSAGKYGMARVSGDYSGNGIYSVFGFDRIDSRYDVHVVRSTELAQKKIIQPVPDEKEMPQGRMFSAAPEKRCIGSYAFMGDNKWAKECRATHSSLDKSIAAYNRLREIKRHDMGMDFTTLSFCQFQNHPLQTFNKPLWPDPSYHSRF